MKYSAYKSTLYNSETSGIYATPRTITAFIVVNNEYEQPYTQQDIKTFKIDSTPVNGKWFGISYSQQLSVTFLDPNKNITINRGDTVQVDLVCNGMAVGYPLYYVDSSIRDEKTGDLTVVGFDTMAQANNRTFTLPDGWSGDYDALCHKCSSLLGANGYAIEGNPSAVPSQIWTKETINIPSDGYSLRDMITAVAEAGGRFAYINSQNHLIFRMVTNNADSEVNNTHNFINAPVKIDKSRYFELTTDNQCVLTGITHKNELNDIVSVGNNNGIVQVLYDNPLLSGLKDIPGGSTAEQQIEAILNNILNNIYTTVTPFNLSWRGNMACEIGDTVWVAEKECTTPASSWVYGSTPGVIWDCFYLSETVEYNGGVRGTAQWEYQPEEKATVGPTNVATSARTTKATVDKVKGEITLEVSRAKGAEQLLGSRITLNENAITSEVKNRQDADSELSSTITQTANSISAEITARENADTELSTRITANENGITSEVSRATGRENELAGDISTITQNVDNISTRVDTVEGNYSTINQTVNEISLEVGNKADANGGALISLINADTSTAKISADKITLEGEVSFIKKGDNVSELTNDKGYLVSDDLGATGTTVIDGGRITTGIISANRLDLSGTLTVGSPISDLTNDEGFINSNDVGPAGSTSIYGGRITTGSIQSDNYTGPTGSSHYSQAGTKMDLDNGVIQTPYFYSDSSGAGFKGTLEGASGTFNGNLTAAATTFNSLELAVGNNLTFKIDGYTSAVGDAHAEMRLTGTVSPTVTFSESGDIVISAPDGILKLRGNGIDIDDNGIGGYVAINNAIITDSSFSGSVTLSSSNYGTSLPSSGSTGEVFYKVVN